MVAKKRRKKRSPTQNWLEYLSFQTFFFLVRLVPFRWGSWVGRNLGWLAFRLLKQRRELTLENIRQAKAGGFLKKVQDEQQLAWRIWEHLGLVGSEFLYYYSRKPERLLAVVTVEGEEHLREALAQKQGVILVMAHIGNWELLGTYLALKYGVSVLVKTQSNPAVDRVIQQRRQSVGMRVIPRTKFLRPVVQALRQNHLVLFLTDQADHHGAPTNFFGRPAWMPRGAAEFALKTGAPAVFAYIVRQGTRQHRIVIQKQFAFNVSGNYQQDLPAALEQLAETLQTVIDRYPEQWLWMHRFWGK